MFYFSLYYCSNFYITGLPHPSCRHAPQLNHLHHLHLHAHCIQIILLLHPYTYIPLCTHIHRCLLIQIYTSTCICTYIVHTLHSIVLHYIVLHYIHRFTWECWRITSPFPKEATQGALRTGRMRRWCPLTSLPARHDGTARGGTPQSGSRVGELGAVFCLFLRFFMLDICHW